MTFPKLVFTLAAIGSYVFAGKTQGADVQEDPVEATSAVLAAPSNIIGRYDPAETDTDPGYTPGGVVTIPACDAKYWNTSIRRTSRRLKKSDYSNKASISGCCISCGLVIRRVFSRLGRHPMAIGALSAFATCTCCRHYSTTLCIKCVLNKVLLPSEDQLRKALQVCSKDCTRSVQDLIYTKIM